MNIIIELATEFGLPCIVRGGLITIIGTEQFIEITFNTNTQEFYLKQSEEVQCQNLTY